MSKFMDISKLFAGRHIAMVSRSRFAFVGYLRYKLSLRDPVEMMDRFGKPASQSWRVDETYLKVCGQWVHLYRAVDRAGQTVDFGLSVRCDLRAAEAFLTKAIKHQGRAPHAVTLNGCAASHRAVRETKADGVLPEDTTVRSSQHLNIVIE